MDRGALGGDLSSIDMVARHTLSARSDLVSFMRIIAK
jgi:hypothetical protein